MTYKVKQSCKVRHFHRSIQSRTKLYKVKTRTPAIPKPTEYKECPNYQSVRSISWRGMGNDQLGLSIAIPLRKILLLGHKKAMSYVTFIDSSTKNGHNCAYSSSKTFEIKTRLQGDSLIYIIRLLFHNIQKKIIECSSVLSLYIFDL